MKFSPTAQAPAVSADEVAMPAQDSPAAPAAPSLSRAYECQCGRPVYLRNSQCLACGTALGYVIERLGVVSLTPGNDADTWAVHDDAQGPLWRRCANFLTAAGCNWMVPLPADAGGTGDHAGDLAEGFCLACSTTRTIPDLSFDGNDALWRKLEAAKRRLLSQLLALGLPVHTRFTDPVHGMSFDFLSSVPGHSHVLTGHQNGVITLNAEEADDAVRERIRAEMREPYRTLLGHLRHEIGHYYWDLLVPGTPWHDGFRALFGDESLDYGAALQTHYDNGPPPDWALRYVTSYASAHPWEDWAETWAHYLHMADTVDTALSFGINAAKAELSGDLFDLADLWQPDHPQAQAFLDFLNGWVRLTNVLNELSRSMGQPDYYPFVLPHAGVGKLQFIHQLVAAQRQPSLLALDATLPDLPDVTAVPEQVPAAEAAEAAEAASTPA